MSSISVIVPVHKLEKTYLDSCILSIMNQKEKPNEVIFVTSNDNELKDYLNNYNFGEISSLVKILENETNDYGFQSQINYGVKESTSTYFTFVEYDDELSPIWIKNAKEYAKHHSDVGVFLPIIYETDENGKFISWLFR